MNNLTEDKRMWVYGLTNSCADIFCFSTTRHGGYSEGNYASFNCNHYCGDDPEKVEQNRTLLCSLMPVRLEMLVIPHQTHGTEVREIDETFVGLASEKQKELLEGVDALVSDCPGVCLCISTADCIPVLCYDTKHKVIAAIHAGWRGTVARIVEKTLERMSELYGTEGEDVRACIGPGISLEAFEVGEEVYEAFKTAGFDMERIARRYAKWHIDLWEANRIQLLAKGVKASNVELAGICTYQHATDFFSARRLGIHSGRILSGIMRMEK